MKTNIEAAVNKSVSPLDNNSDLYSPRNDPESARADFKLIK